MKTNDECDLHDVRPEYDLSRLTGRTQGKHAARYQARTNVVRLAPDVAAAFPDETSVNEARRMLIDLAKAQVPH